MEFQKNQIITVEIEDISTEGEGIGKVDGFPLFIKDALPGDLVRAKILKTKKNYGFARVEEILRKSKDRVTPKCPYHRQCGGCQIQALNYRKQLEFKQNKVKNNLIRIGGFSENLLEQIMEPIIGMEEPWRYRNKAQYPVGYSKEGNLIAGFYAGRTHSIIASTDCYIGVKENQQILEIVLSHMENRAISAYDEKTGKGLVRHILIRKGFSSGEIMVCIIINAKPGKQKDELQREALISSLQKVKSVQSICINYNYNQTNVIMGDETEVIWGKDTISDCIRLLEVKGQHFVPTKHAVEYAISARSFYQVNPVQTEKLYSTALDFADLKGEEIVWDLYCGIGTISLFLAQKAKKVFGVEIIPQAIADAAENARRNGIKNAQFFVGKAEEVLPSEYGKNPCYADVIVVDPPRKGCDEKCLETILQMKPSKIVYVSCDSATLARDLHILCQGGYDLSRVRACDQFCHSTHVETVCLLSKKSQ